MPRTVCLPRADVRRLLCLTVELMDLHSRDGRWIEQGLRDLCAMVDADAAFHWRDDGDCPRLSSCGLPNRVCDDLSRALTEVSGGTCRCTSDGESPANLGDWIRCATSLENLFVAMQDESDPATHCFCIGRRSPGAPFTGREETLLDLAFREIVLNLERRRPAHRTAFPNEPSLSPRLREVLGILLDGASEKEIARRLCRSPHTIHRYVVTLYRLFDVSSRAELLSRFIPAGRM